jgi:hypothetical protein
VKDHLWDECCAECPDSKIRHETVDVGMNFQHLHESEMLQRAGYPFEADDLTRTEWMGIAVLREERESIRMSRMFGGGGEKKAINPDPNANGEGADE